VNEGVFDSRRSLNGWIEKLNNALKTGFDGLRLSGNTSWMEKRDWDDFVDYEDEVDRILGNYRMIALCTYSLDRCSSTGIIDVMVNHQFALIKKKGEWQKRESSRSKKAEEIAVQATRNWEYTFDAIPDLVAILDDQYRIVRANRAMASKLNVAPEECAGLICYKAVHGTDEPPSFCPHRQLLKDGLEHTAEVYEDCFGGYFLVSVSPLHDSEGKLIGSVHVARDINERKQAEDALRQSEQHARLKLEKILSPVSSPDTFELSEIVDIPVIQSLINDFYKLTNVPIGLNDLKGNVLACVGWQEICTRFHRVHPETCRYCRESDMELSMGISPGEYKLYRCRNNMWDVTTPVMVAGKQVGIIFSGQFFLRMKFWTMSFSVLRQESMVSMRTNTYQRLRKFRG
jgi:PAS domain S-box-containing protein